jgi:aminopeptidase
MIVLFVSALDIHRHQSKKRLRTSNFYCLAGMLMAKGKDKKANPEKKHGSGMWKAARVAMNEVMAVKKDETVLIITNPVDDVMAISSALYDATVAAGGAPTLQVQQVKSQLDFAEPSVLKAIGSQPNIIISISHNKLGKDKELMKRPIKVGKKSYDHIFNYLLGERISRSFWSPSITRNMFIKTVPVNYPQMRALCKKLSTILTRANDVHIKTAKGMDLTIGLKGRKGQSDDGDFRKPGSGGNLPCGEVYISPELGASNGTIVFDGSIASYKGEIIIKRPIEVKVKNGFVTKVSGGIEAKELQDTLTRAGLQVDKFVKEGKLSKGVAGEYKKNIFNLGELGIGLNRNCSIVGNILEDEKVFKTCHIAIGANYDEDANTLIHLDGIIKNPTMTVNIGGKSKTIMEKGTLVNLD